MSSALFLGIGMIHIKNWKKHQHYKDRRPPWIKLYRELLDNPEWFSLSGDDGRMLINLWLIASETNDGMLPDSDTLAFRLRTDSKTIDQSIKTLVLKGFLYDDSEMLAGCEHDASIEREGEVKGELEREGEKEGESDSSQARAFPPDVQFVFDLYSEKCPGLPQVRNPEKTEIGQRIAKDIKARTKGNQLTNDGWVSLFDYVSKSDFLNGRNDRGWKASLDWIVSKANFGKILSQKYQNSTAGSVDDFVAQTEAQARRLGL